LKYQNANKHERLGKLYNIVWRYGHSSVVWKWKTKMVMWWSWVIVWKSFSASLSILNLTFSISQSNSAPLSSNIIHPLLHTPMVLFFIQIGENDSLITKLISHIYYSILQILWKESHIILCTSDLLQLC